MPIKIGNTRFLRCGKDRPSQCRACSNFGHDALGPQFVFPQWHSGQSTPSASGVSSSDGAFEATAGQPTLSPFTMHPSWLAPIIRKRTEEEVVCSALPFGPSLHLVHASSASWLLATPNAAFRLKTIGVEV